MTAPLVFIRPAAMNDLDELSIYIAKNSPRAAHRFLDAADQTFDFLAADPTCGAPCEFDHPIAGAVRRWRIRGFEKYLIFYHPHARGVEIVRVIHGSRDLQQAFTEEPPA